MSNALVQIQLGIYWTRNSTWEPDASGQAVARRALGFGMSILIIWINPRNLSSRREPAYVEQ